MKKYATIAAICLLIASLHARADVIVVENLDMHTAGQSQDAAKGTSPAGKHTALKNVTVKVKGDKLREDLLVGTAISVIIDFNTGDMVTLMHGQKKFVKISAEKLKGIVPGGVKKAIGLDNAPERAVAPEIVDTGKQEIVESEKGQTPYKYNTEVYTTELHGVKYTIWMTKDVPNYASIEEQTKKGRALAGKLGLGGAFPDTSKIDGMVVKMEMVANDGQTTILTIVSAKEEPVDDADFQIPADYTETEMPHAPGGASTPPAQP